MPQRGASEEHCDPFQENVAFTFAPKYVLYPLPVRTCTLRSRSPARRPVCRCRDATDRDNKRSLLRPGEPRGSERLHPTPAYSTPPPLRPATDATGSKSQHDSRRRGACGCALTSGPLVPYSDVNAPHIPRADQAHIVQ
jgi:hypothetical protein